MLLKEFPDINWLKKQARSNFADQKDINQNPLNNSGWPTVLLQVKTRYAERKDIKGPFSLFMNTSGQSNVKADGKTVNVDSDTFVCTNPGQNYDLNITQGAETETFNIHFGEKLFKDTVCNISKDHSQLLSNPSFDPEEYNYPIRSKFKDQKFNQLITWVASSYDSEENEESLHYLLSYLIGNRSKEFSNILSMDCVKKSTREELCNRVFLAVDYIHAYFSKHIELEELAQVACLSKFHFLRIFKSVFGLSPHQYIKKIRIQKAIELIKHSDLPLYLIAQQIGIENGSSLSRMIYQTTGKRPSTLI